MKKTKFFETEDYVCPKCGKSCLTDGMTIKKKCKCVTIGVNLKDFNN